MPASLHEVLRGRVRARVVKTQTSFQLDLRGPVLGDLGQLTMRLPGARGWPKAGPTITTREVAVSDVVLEAYARHVEACTAGARTRAAGRVITVDRACDDYLLWLEGQEGKGSNTYKNQRSAIVHHIKPRWTGQPVTVLLPEPVGEWLAGLQVTKHKDCVAFKTPASLNAKKHVRTTLGAVWKHSMRGAPAPFAGVVLKDRSARAARREAARTGEEPWRHRRTCYSPSEVRRIAAFAWALDQLNILDKPNVRCRVNPVTAEAIIWSVGLATRVQELMDIRRRHINLSLRTIWIPGTKTDNAARHMIITDSFGPWVERMLGRVPDDPSAFVFRVDPREKPSPNATSPSRKTYGGRIARAEAAAGLKFEQEATHLFRDTAITWMTAEGIDPRLLKVLIGHGDPLGGITSEYLSPELFLDLALEIQPDVRRHLVQLPTPEEVEADGATLLAGMRAERAERRARRRASEAAPALEIA